MKTLQNDFTTPEQSKRLLELGVPEWTANLYTFYSGKTIVARQNVYERRKDFFTKTRKDGYKPIWSVGRLMEIFEICDNLPEETRSNMCCIPSLKRMSYMEYMIKCYEKAIENEFLDFSKLEE